MGIGEALLAEGVIVLLGRHIARVTADLDVWDLVTKHWWQGGGLVVATVAGVKVGSYWRGMTDANKQMKESIIQTNSDLEHIKKNMLTEDKLENTLLRLEDHFDDKYVIRGEKPNGKVRGGERMR